MYHCLYQSVTMGIAHRRGIVDLTSK